MAQNFDLFGDPIPANWGKRGRPQHVATRENINKVTMLVALGWSNPRVANALDITLPTLRKHYFALINRLRDTARDRLDAAYAMRIWAQVDAGNVGAMRLWASFLERNDQMSAEFAMGGVPDAPDEPANERLGKKVISQRAAIEADAELSAELEQEASQHGVH